MRCNELSDKLATYDKLKATGNGIGIAGMTVTEIIENLPMVSDDIAAIIDALVDAYGEMDWQCISDKLGKNLTPL